MKGKIAAACSAAAMAVFGSVALAAPAHAADWEQACFTFADGTPWAGLSTQLHVFDGSQWILASETNADANGCAAFTMSGSYAMSPSHIMVYVAFSDGAGGTAYEWSSVSADAPAEHRTVNLGTYIIYCTPRTLSCPVRYKV